MHHVSKEKASPLALIYLCHRKPANPVSSSVAKDPGKEIQGGSNR